MELFAWVLILAAVVALVAIGPGRVFGAIIGFVAAMPVVLIVLAVLTPIILVLAIVLLPIMGLVTAFVTFTIVGALLLVPLAAIAKIFSRKHSGGS